MPQTLTIRNVLDSIARKLKTRAERNHTVFENQISFPSTEGGGLGWRCDLPSHASISPPSPPSPIKGEGVPLEISDAA